MTQSILDAARVRHWKQYTDCVPTNEEWLGQIPRHWDATRIKYLCQVKRGASPRPIDDRAYFDDDGEYAWVRISDVTASEKYLLKTTERLSILGQSKSVKLEPGRIFLSIAATVGKAIITKIKCCIHDGFVYFDHLKQNPEFWYYLFESNQLFVGLGKLGTQLNLNTETIGNIRIPVPPLAEQRAIAAFLDRETARIDALIGHKERLVALLEEKRQAVVTHAVTRGLDPNAKLKNSRIEWFGYVPKHWRVTRLGWVSETINDINHEMPQAVEIGVPFLSAKDLLNDGTLNFTENVKCISEEDFLRLSRKIRPRRNDIIYSRIGACLGKARLVETDDRFLISYSCCVVRVNQEVAVPAFFRHLLDTDIVLTEAKMRTQGIGVPDLGLKEISSFPVPVPPVEEQKEIVAYLDVVIPRLNQLMSRVQDGISRLQEYRTALISAAVTGQIDVCVKVDLND